MHLREKIMKRGAGRSRAPDSLPSILPESAIYKGGKGLRSRGGEPEPGEGRRPEKRGRLTIKSQVSEGRNPEEISQTTAAFDKQHSSAGIGRARAMEGTANKATAALAKRECST